MPDDISAGHLFHLFMKNKIIALFVIETNLYACQVTEKRGANGGTHSYFTLWKDITF